jgi:hypothetical protein
MPFAKNEKGLEVDAAGNVVAEKYDRHALPGDDDYGSHVPVVHDQNVAHERLKEVAAENPGLEVDASDNYIVVTPEEARETGALGPVSPVAPPGSAADPSTGHVGGTESSGLMDRVQEKAAENREKSEAAAAEADEASDADDESDGPAAEPSQPTY